VSDAGAVTDVGATPAQDSWGAGCGDLQQRAREGAARKKEEIRRHLETAETFDEGTPSDVIEDYIKRLCGLSVAAPETTRALATIKKKLKKNITADNLRDLVKKHTPPRVRSTMSPQLLAEAKPGMALWDFLELQQSADGTHVLDNLNNASKVLRADTRLAGRLWFDEFANRIQTTIAFPPHQPDCLPPAPREWTEHDSLRLTTHMQANVGMAYVKVETVKQAVTMIAMDTRINPPQQWMESLVWDGVERLHLAMSAGFGAERTDYTEAVGRCFFVSMAARVYQPGCQVDTVPVFEGAQGIGKSSALRVIGGAWFAECNESVMTKDFYQVIEGNMLVEVPELNSFSRAEVTKMKSIITCRTDRYRAPYEAKASDHPRRTVLSGTTNQDDWNADGTGARRFWPIYCHAINLAWLREHRDQFFAEAVARLKRGEAWHDVPHAQAAIEQDARRPVDEWTDAVIAFVDGGFVKRGGHNSPTWLGTNEVTASEVLLNAIDLPIDRHTRPDFMRVADILKRHGFEKAERAKAKVKGEVRSQKWRRDPPKRLPAPSQGGGAPPA
jgi:predicted P-loop ATPase